MLLFYAMINKMCILKNYLCHDIKQPVSYHGILSQPRAQTNSGFYNSII